MSFHINLSRPRVSTFTRISQSCPRVSTSIHICLSSPLVSRIYKISLSLPHVSTSLRINLCRPHVFVRYYAFSLWKGFFALAFASLSLGKKFPPFRGTFSLGKRFFAFARDVLTRCTLFRLCEPPFNSAIASIRSVSLVFAR